MSAVLSVWVGQLLVLSVLTVVIIGNIVSELYLKKFHSDEGGTSGRYGAITIGLSYYAAGMGAWVLSLGPHVGGKFGLVGVVGYGLACSLPQFLVMWLGPLVRAGGVGSAAEIDACNSETTTPVPPPTPPTIPSLTDWVRNRFGISMAVLISLVSLFYMGTFMITELRTVGEAVELLTGLPAWRSVVPVAAISSFQSQGGFLGHAVQGVACAILVAVGVACSLTSPPTGTPPPPPSLVPSFISVFTLCLSVASAELMNMTEWQRVWASKNKSSLRGGLMIAIALVWGTVSCFGLVGYQERGGGDIDGNFYNVFFDAVGRAGPGVGAVAALIVLALASSTVSALQGAILGVLWGWVGNKFNRFSQKLLSISISLVFSGICSYVALEARIPLIDLFMIANWIAGAVAVPVFLGLLKRVGRLGAGFGVISAVVVGLGWGWVKEGKMTGIIQLTTEIWKWETLLFFSISLLTGGLVTIGSSWFVDKLKFPASEQRGQSDISESRV